MNSKKERNEIILVTIAGIVFLLILLIWVSFYDGKERFMNDIRNSIALLFVMISLLAILGVIGLIASVDYKNSTLNIGIKKVIVYCVFTCFAIVMFWKFGYEITSEYIIKPHQIISQNEFIKKTKIMRDENIITVSFSKEKTQSFNKEEKYIYKFYYGDKYCDYLEMNDAHVFDEYDKLEIKKTKTYYVVPNEYRSFVDGNHGEMQSYYAYEITDGTYTENSKLPDKTGMKVEIKRSYSIYKNYAENSNNGCYIFINIITLLFVAVGMLCYFLVINNFNEIFGKTKRLGEK